MSCIISSGTTSLVSSMLLSHKLKRHTSLKLRISHCFQNSTQPIYVRIAAPRQVGTMLLYGLPRCFVFVFFICNSSCFRRFARCNFYFYISFVSQIVIFLVFVLIEWSAIIPVFVFIFVTKIALLPTVGFEPWSSHAVVRHVTARPLRPAVCTDCSGQPRQVWIVRESLFAQNMQATRTRRAYTHQCWCPLYNT